MYNQLSEDEENEINSYIYIYKKYNFVEHYEVNNFISRQNAWDKFPNIRSLNDHGVHKGIPGILPKFYAIICERLKIEGAGGAPIDEAHHY